LFSSVAFVWLGQLCSFSTVSTRRDTIPSTFRSNPSSYTTTEKSAKLPLNIGKTKYRQPLIGSLPNFNRIQALLAANKKIGAPTNYSRGALTDSTNFPRATKVKLN
jgi:hypothetical protein